MTIYDALPLHGSEISTLSKDRGPVSQFMEHHFRHFNAAALKDAAVGYEQHLQAGGKMLFSLGER